MSPLRRSFRARQAEWRMAVCLIPLFSLGCAYYGAYGGPEADLWDRDRDGTFDWWEPGPWPGWPWDCDDQDPARATGPGC